MEAIQRSYENVEGALNSVFADDPITEFSVCGRRALILPGSPELVDNSTPLKFEWYTYLNRGTGPTPLKFEMITSSIPREIAVPGTLEISKANQHEFVSICVPMSLQLRPGSAFMVRDFLQFLEDEGLLRYRIDKETHPCYWHFEVVKRLAAAGTIAGGSALKIAREIEEYNKLEADYWTKQAKKQNPVPDPIPPPPYVDVNVGLKAGEFVKTSEVDFAGNKRAGHGIPENIHGAPHSKKARPT